METRAELAARMGVPESRLAYGGRQPLGKLPSANRKQRRARQREQRRNKR